MILTIDGYDGTGKTTLAKGLCSKLDYIYLDKPFIIKHMCDNNCSYIDAKKETGLIEKQLFHNGDKREIAKYYLESLKWLSSFIKDSDVILDRGLLTTYAVVGNDETKEIFIDYINSGAFFDGSIYLIADDLERVNRIYLNDPNDPDLKYPVKWRDNDLEEFADIMNLNYYKIDTNNRTKEEVLDMSLDIINNNYVKKLEHK